jgi:hypothetical protein
VLLGPMTPITTEASLTVNSDDRGDHPVQSDHLFGQGGQPGHDQHDVVPSSGWRQTWLANLRPHCEPTPTDLPLAWSGWSPWSGRS